MIMDWHEVDCQGDLKSSLHLQRIFSRWPHSAMIIVYSTPQRSMAVLRDFPFLGCIADAAAAGRGDLCTAESAAASYKSLPFQFTIRVLLRSSHQLEKVSIIFFEVSPFVLISTPANCLVDGSMRYKEGKDDLKPKDNSRVQY